MSTVIKTKTDWYFVETYTVKDDGRNIEATLVGIEENIEARLAGIKERYCKCYIYSNEWAAVPVPPDRQVIYSLLKDIQCRQYYAIELYDKDEMDEAINILCYYLPVKSITFLKGKDYLTTKKPVLRLTLSNNCVISLYNKDYSDLPRNTIRLQKRLSYPY